MIKLTVANKDIEIVEELLLDSDYQIDGNQFSYVDTAAGEMAQVILEDADVSYKLDFNGIRAVYVDGGYYEEGDEEFLSSYEIFEEYCK